MVPKVLVKRVVAGHSFHSDCTLFWPQRELFPDFLILFLQPSASSGQVGSAASATYSEVPPKSLSALASCLATI